MGCQYTVRMNGRHDDRSCAGAVLCLTRSRPATVNDSRHTTPPVPGLIPTIPNTAVAFIVGGLAVLSASRERDDERFVPITRVLAVALTALGALFFIEQVANIDFGVDLLLFGDAVRAMEWQPTGRPAINSSLVMTLDGAALLAIDARTARGRRPAELLAGLAVFVAFAAIIGY